MKSFQWLLCLALILLVYASIDRLLSKLSPITPRDDAGTSKAQPQTTNLTTLSPDELLVLAVELARNPAEYSRPRSGPVAGALDATFRSVFLANQSTYQSYQLKPFSPTNTIATFNGQHWIWRNRVGAGHGDFEATILIDTNGHVLRSSVHYLSHQFSRL